MNVKEKRNEFIKKYGKLIDSNIERLGKEAKWNKLKDNLFVFFVFLLSITSITLTILALYFVLKFKQENPIPPDQFTYFIAMTIALAFIISVFFLQIVNKSFTSKKLTIFYEKAVDEMQMAYILISTNKGEYKDLKPEEIQEKIIAIIDQIEKEIREFKRSKKSVNFASNLVNQATGGRR